VVVRDAGITIDDDAQEAITSGDALLLERMVQNLVENGIQHNVDNADGWVRVVTRTHPYADSIEVEFSNTGPVVPRYETPTLFEPFRRLKGDRLTAKGAGLGLSIV
jgi:signal transduction histidine kinase